MKIVRFPEGCEVSLYIPLIEMTEGGQPIDPTKLTDLVASVSLHGVVYQITPLVTESCLVMPLSADLKAGQYIISYSFKYDGRPCSGRWANALEIVKDNAQSNWQGYVATKYVLDDQIFIAAPTMTDEELERLKEEYRAKIAEEEAVIEEYEEKIRSLDDMAKETTSQQIKEQTNGVAKKTDLPTDYARQGEYDAKLSALSTKVGESPDGKTLFEAIAAGGGGGGSTSITEITDQQINEIVERVIAR